MFIAKYISRRFFKMKTKLSQKEKQELVNRYLAGESVQSIIIDTGVARSTMYSWIKSYKKSLNTNTNITLREFSKKIQFRQNLAANAPNKIWASDVTQIKVNNFNFYICVIIDVFSLKVVSYHIAKKSSTQLTKITFKKAYESRQPIGSLLFHSDRGSNYISNTFIKYLKSLGIRQSFSRAHAPYDNSVCESFFGIFKREELYRYTYPTVAEFKRRVNMYINFYNDERRHASLNHTTPTTYEKDFLHNKKCQV